MYKVATEKAEALAVISGKLRFSSDIASEYPAVGDYVMLDREDDTTGNAVINKVLKRKSVFIRKAAGTSHEVQVVAANIDIVFICMSLNNDFNLRRLERYLAISWESKARPVVVLTKADLCEDLPEKLREVSMVSAGAEVVVCSAIAENGWRNVESFIEKGRTVAFIGSSGVGKSTLINKLLGREALATREIREDDGRGRHTTTHRQLLLLPGGGLVIDTPGMRELQLFTSDLTKTFEDIEELAVKCRFKDCSHGSEPGCAVRAAVESGLLSEKRLDSYVKLQREASYEGLSSRETEMEKINRMFGGKGEMKQAMRYAKNKNKR
jgi:ribosome biogenesis GTPase